MLLSICIPFYNRLDELKKNIKSIFKSNSDEFEVIIIDNCSSCNTEEELGINDYRLRYVKRKKAIDGRLNISTCFEYAYGEFCLLCLDKDYIDGNGLDEFINQLKKLPSVYGGYCAQNILHDGNIKISYNDEAAIKFSYLSRHPSGYFYKTEIVKEALNKMDYEEKINPFCPDILCTICSVRGNMMDFNKRMIFLEDPEKAAEIKTYSYREENLLYFYPENRTKQFIFYCKHMEKIHISKNVKDKIFYRLYKTNLVRVSFGYRTFMKNEKWCEHYMIKTRDITFKELINSKNYFMKSASLLIDSKIKRLFMLFYYNTYFYIKLLKELCV